MAVSNHTETQQDPLESWLHLLHTPGIGPATFHVLLDAFGTAEAALNANGQQLTKLAINPDIISSLSHPEKLDISADLAWLAQEDHHHIITWHN